MRYRRLLTLALLPVLLTACVTETKVASPVPSQAPSKPRPKPVIPPELRGLPATPETAVRSDASANQLHDLTALLLLYYAANRHLPPTLEALAPYASEPLKLTSPGTNLPYVYDPNGLTSPNQPKPILLHEATPAPNGVRWCILLASPLTQPNLALEVLPVPEALFRGYTPR